MASDKLGRRYAALTGTVVTCIGGAVQAGSHGKSALAMMVIGRILSGFGNAIISTSVPLYQSEIAPAKRRGGLVVMNHIGMVSGLATAFWVGYGVSHWKTSTGFTQGWRLAVSLQFIPALLFVIGLPFVPETPRWLLEQGRPPDAQKSLEYLRGCDENPDAVSEELNEIKENVELHNTIDEAPWHVLFTDRNLLARLWRGAVLQFMAQMCGATAIKYYLPTVFLALGLSKDLSLMAGGIESTLKIGCSIIEMLIIDKLGRRRTLLLGSGIMSLSMLINGALPLAYPGNANRASDYACIVFIFFFSFGYSIGFGPNAWVYGTEIFPTHVRAKGINISASAGAIGSIAVGQYFPVAIDNIKSKTYFIFFSINIVSFIVLAIFYPETKGRTLEQMDDLFGKLLSDPERDHAVLTDEEHENGDQGHVEEQTVLGNSKL
ncbi:general substrate transporter [Cadophora sp. DSE1049]|nr:general substrate transporter [Cadophora sp. DSE1049]